MAPFCIYDLSPRKTCYFCILPCVTIEEHVKGGLTDTKLRKISTLLFAKSDALVKLGAKIDGLVETMELVVNCAFLKAQEQTHGQDSSFNLGTLKAGVEVQLGFKRGQQQGLQQAQGVIIQASAIYTG